MLKYIVPRIAAADLRPMLLVAFVGGVIAGLYGILHDQITYAISPEYFTNLKFKQFRYANLGLGNRVFASTVGFLATFGVGIVAGWLLARRFIPSQPRRAAYHQIGRGIACIFNCAVLFGLCGYFYGLWRGPHADYTSWHWALEKYAISDHWSFVRVAYIHNSGYLGGVVGLIGALIAIRPNKEGIDETRGCPDCPRR